MANVRSIWKGKSTKKYYYTIINETSEQFNVEIFWCYKWWLETPSNKLPIYLGLFGINLFKSNQLEKRKEDSMNEDSVIL